MLAELYDGKIRVNTTFQELNLIKQVPGARWNTKPDAKFWTVPLSWASCLSLRGVFGDALEIGPDLRSWAWIKKNENDSLLALRTRTELENPVEGSPLFPFQQVGVRFLRESRTTILGDEMGTGKTIQALSALREIHNTPGDIALPALVICPNSVKSNWGTECKRWFPESNSYVLSGGKVARDKILEQALTDDNALVVVNFEALKGLTRISGYGSTRLIKCDKCDPAGTPGLSPAKCQKHSKELNKFKWAAVIVDEAHRIKDPKALQTRGAWALAHQETVRYRWALSGTPLANHPGDLWSLLHFIEPGEFPAKTSFVDRYCQTAWNPWGGLDVIGVRAATRSEFFGLLDPHFRRMPKELVLSQLPPKVRSVRFVEMSAKQRKAYDALETALSAEVEGGSLIASEPLVARMRQMQLASATVKIANPDADIHDWQVELCEPAPKLDVLEEILEELGDKPLVVCAESRQLIELAAKRLEKLKISHGLITGKVPEFERQRVLRQFQAGGLRVLLFTVKAGGVGLTMTAADTIVFLQRSWSMIDNKQAEDRVHRIGSEKNENVNVIDIVTKDSVEEGQILTLTQKLERLQEIVRDRELISINSAKYDVQSAIDALNAEEELLLTSGLESSL